MAASLVELIRTRALPVSFHAWAGGRISNEAVETRITVERVETRVDAYVCHPA
jgi:hypothetical protein